MIEIHGLSRAYGTGPNRKKVLDDIDLRIETGNFTAVLGSSGCGKSTLAKHLNAILKPERGSVIVDGMDTRDSTHVFDIRERVGMVFQDPDSQAVASIVEDDVAFAPENLGLDEKEINERVGTALASAGITELRKKSIASLSGGQKQLTAIAGILAMRPKYMIFDESTSMLDPAARSHIMQQVMRLRSEFGITIIWITHYMDEAAKADRIIVIDKGRIAADGTPYEVFSEEETIARCGLELPPCARLCARLMRSGYPIRQIALDARSCAAAIYEAAAGRTI